MKETVKAAARNFLENETEFHLGFLPTEQSNPITRNLDRAFSAGTAEGVRLLQRADREVLPMARKIFASAEFRRMVDAGEKTVKGGGRIVFSGCGATGRLSILLESMWREFFAARPGDSRADSVASIMTGGDYALIRSVEFFEDYQSFGRRQVADLEMGEKDMLVAITEGGETSSVIGTVKEAVERGSAVFLLFNNPAALLRERLVRCREVIDDPAVTVLDLCCGPMAVAGSTRMQATTCEQLVGGALLETILAERNQELPAPENFADSFERVLDHLESADSVAAIAGEIDFEAETYSRHGKVTYFANAYLLDLFTDTTERSPTFMLPPFRRKDDPAAVPSWAFVKNPCYSTRETWRHMLRRAPRCLEWPPADYITMGAQEKIVAAPPRISVEDLYQMEVGNEPAPERYTGKDDAAVLVLFPGASGNPELSAAFETASAPYPVRRTLELRSGATDSPLGLMHHMAVKLALNTISTGTMVKLGRVAGNWMSYVDISNKKLVDRAIRLISELGKLPYEEACYALFDAVEAMAREDWSNREKPSPVQYTLARIGRK